MQKKRNPLIFLWLLITLMMSLSCYAVADNTALGGGANWDGMYSTNARDRETQGQWATPSSLLVDWGKEVQYGGTAIGKARFFNNSSISWTGDSNWGNGQIWFTYGDNRTQYWPDGAVEGRVFVGWIQADLGSYIDFRGINATIPPGEQKRCDGVCPDQMITCKSCSNGKVCSNGQCICPSGTTDCSGQCIVPIPCGGCEGGKICSNGKCICPVGTKECNARCIRITECCGGCPPWKTCNKGKCVCPPGINDCPDPLPL